MMVITSESDKVERRCRCCPVAINNFCFQMGSKSRQKSSMSQKTGKISMERTPFGWMVSFGRLHHTGLGSLFNSYVELTLVRPYSLENDCPYPSVGDVRIEWMECFYQGQ